MDPLKSVPFIESPSELLLKQSSRAKICRIYCNRLLIESVRVRCNSNMKEICARNRKLRYARLSNRTGSWAMSQLEEAQRRQENEDQARRNNTSDIQMQDV